MADKTPPAKATNAHFAGTVKAQPEVTQPAHKPHFRRHHPVRGIVQLKRWQLLGVYFSFGLLAASGMLWLALHGLALLAQTPDADALPSPAKAWALRIHAAGALAALVSLGSLLPVHVVSAWQQGRNRYSGAFNLALMAILTLTGYALWYASEGTPKQLSAWLHWALGAAMPVVLIAHIVLGRRSHR